MKLQHTHISSKHKYFDLKLNEVIKYKDLILLFTKRTFQVSYKQTILGPLWLIINPVLTAVFQLILFGKIANLSTDGVPQILFYFSGNAIWSFFSSCILANSATFTGYSSLFGKVYFPRLVIPVSNALTKTISFLIQFVMLLAMMVYFSFKNMVSFSFWTLLAVPFLLLHLGILGTGIGIIVSSLTTKYRDLSVLVSFGVQLLMYATPVVYPMSAVPEGLRKILFLNPVTQPVELFRKALFNVGTISPKLFAYSVVVTLAVAFFGIVLFNKVERTFMDTI